MRSKVHVSSVVVKEGLSGRRFYEDIVAQLQGGIKEYVTAALNQALDQEVDHLLGRELYARRDENNQKRVKAKCLGCGSRRQQDFLRNGHKYRGLVTLWATTLTILMPRLKCSICGGTVQVAYETIGPRQRLWYDLGEETRTACGLGQSLREIKGQLDSRLGTSFGLRVLNEQVREMSTLVEGWQGGGLAAPPVLLLDAL
jgi:hypothetical protein